MRPGLLEGRMSGVKSGVLCQSSSVLLRTRGALESKSCQQLDRCLAVTVWAARHTTRYDSVYLTCSKTLTGSQLSPPHGKTTSHHYITVIVLCTIHFHPWLHDNYTRAWSHRLKLTHRIMFIRNQRGMSMSWNGIWLKYGQQPAELY